MRKFIPMDVIHLIVTASASLFFAGLFILVPMFFSRVGKEKWPSKANALVYFSCLGAGFIIIELVLIQIFMKLIGYPLYTYTTVLFALLVSAGIGSLYSEKLRISPTKNWTWPYVGIGVTGTLLLVSYSHLFEIFLATPEPIRILVAALMIVPIGFFLGMPFPLGILWVQSMRANLRLLVFLFPL